MTKWLKFARECVVYGAIALGLIAWLCLILGSFLGLAGWEPQAERMFEAARSSAFAFLALLLVELVLTVARPNR